MKKLFTIAALAALTTTSCSLDKEVDVKQDMIGFGTYVGKTNTRAIEETTDDIRNGSTIGIFANMHSGDLVDNFDANFMNNDELRYDNGWKYDNTKYWPNNGDKISFFAYHPYTSAATSFDVTAVPSIGNGSVIIPFTVNLANPSKQTDLLWATVQNATKPEGNAPIKFAFNHALSKIQFKVKAASDYKNCSIRIKKVELSGLIASGTYSVDYKTSTGIWTEKGYFTSSCTPYQIDGDKRQVVTTELQDLGTFATNGLLLIPQAHVQGTNLNIDYEVIYKDNGFVVAESKTFNLQGTNSWEQNKVYTYTFNIALNEITFGVMVNDWVDGTNKDLMN